MFNLQGSEIIFILLIALVVLGPEKLPGAIRKATQTYNELRKMSTGFQSEFRSALDEPMRDLRQTADMIRESADPTKIVADARRESPSSLAAERSAEHGLDDAADTTIAEHGMKPVSAVMADASDVADPVADEPRPADEPTTPDSTTAGGAPVIDEWADPVGPDQPGPVPTPGGATAPVARVGEPGAGDGEVEERSA